MNKDEFIEILRTINDQVFFEKNVIRQHGFLKEMSNNYTLRCTLITYSLLQKVTLVFSDFNEFNHSTYREINITEKYDIILNHQDNYLYCNRSKFEEFKEDLKELIFDILISGG